MAETTPENEAAKKKRHTVTFTCQRCHKSWSIDDMRRITRFRPVMVVCPDCEKELR